MALELVLPVVSGKLSRGTLVAAVFKNYLINRGGNVLPGRRRMRRHKTPPHGRSSALASGYVFGAFGNILALLGLAESGQPVIP